MIIRIKGNLSMPENLYETISAIKNRDEIQREGYLSSFERLIGPVKICTLFGLYKSQELPPMDKEEISLAKSHEFNVDISTFADAVNHFLFCLWVKKKGTPETSTDIVSYREELYYFISKLLDANYYRTVLIPFYLSKADEADESGTSSFSHRMASSDNVKLTLEDYSPEFLAREFCTAQNEFINSVIAPFNKKE
jgi:hypothetical protein